MTSTLLVMPWPNATRSEPLPFELSAIRCSTTLPLVKRTITRAAEPIDVGGRSKRMVTWPPRGWRVPGTSAAGR